MSNSKKRDLITRWDELFNSQLDSVGGDVTIREESAGKFDDIVERNTQLFLRLRTKALAELNQGRFDRVLKFLETFSSNLQANVAEAKNFAEEILSKPKFAELKPMFRNMSNITESDKQEILTDAKLLDLLDDAEQEFERKTTNDL